MQQFVSDGRVFSARQISLKRWNSCALQSAGIWLVSLIFAALRENSTGVNGQAFFSYSDRSAHHRFTALYRPFFLLLRSSFVSLSSLLCILMSMALEIISNKLFIPLPFGLPPKSTG